MDTIAHNLRPVSNRITIPRSVPGLVTRRVLVRGGGAGGAGGVRGSSRGRARPQQGACTCGMHACHTRARARPHRTRRSWSLWRVSH